MHVIDEMHIIGEDGGRVDGWMGPERKKGDSSQNPH